jgi:hypothetical protein
LILSATSAEEAVPSVVVSPVGFCEELALQANMAKRVIKGMIRIVFITDKMISDYLKEKA